MALSWMNRESGSPDCEYIVNARRVCRSATGSPDSFDVMRPRILHSLVSKEETLPGAGAGFCVLPAKHNSHNNNESIWRNYTTKRSASLQATSQKSASRKLDISVRGVTA